MPTFGTRLKHLREKQQLTFADLAEQIGEITGSQPSRSTVHKWENDRVDPHSINDKSRRALAQVLDVSVEFLLDGKAAKGSNQQVFAERVTKRLDTDTAAGGQTFVPLPLFTVVLSATRHGHPKVEFQPTMETLSVELLRLPSASRDTSQLRTITIDNSDMEKTLWPGDHIVVDISKREIKDGAVYALAYADKLRIKRLFWTADGRLRVVSDNPAVREETIEKADIGSVYIIGQVVHKDGNGGLTL